MRLSVPAFDGSITVTIPAGTQPSSVLRLRSKGLPEFGGGRRGALYVCVLVQIPEQWSSEERSLDERLRAIQPRPTATRPPAPTGGAQSNARPRTDAT